MLKKCMPIKKPNHKEEEKLKQTVGSLYHKCLLVHAKKSKLESFFVDMKQVQLGS